MPATTFDYVLIKAPAGVDENFENRHVNLWREIHAWCVQHELTFNYHGTTLARGISYMAWKIPDDAERTMFMLKWK